MIYSRFFQLHKICAAGCSLRPATTQEKTKQNSKLPLTHIQLVISETVRAPQCKLTHCTAEGQTPNLKKSYYLTHLIPPCIYCRCCTWRFGLNPNDTSACYIIRCTDVNSDYVMWNFLSDRDGGTDSCGLTDTDSLRGGRRQRRLDTHLVNTSYIMWRLCCASLHNLQLRHSKHCRGCVAV